MTSKHNLSASAMFTLNDKANMTLTQKYRSKGYAADDFSNTFTQRQMAYNSTDFNFSYKTDKELELKSIEYRKTILDIIYNGGAGHTSGSLSCIEILNVLYNNVLKINPNNFNSTDRNRYVQSKGHTVEAL